MKTSRLVIAFGVFDLLHPGHLHFLRSAKKLGDTLIVVVSRDSRVMKEKGRTPVFNEKERLAMIKSLNFVDNAALGDKPGEWKIVKKIKPSIIVVGHDQKIPDHIKGEYVIKRVRSTFRDRYSSSRIRKALENNGM